MYARELLRAGYAVHALDAMPGHAERLRADPALAGLSSVTLGDARALPYPDAGADAALLLGPLYHLTDPRDRARALAEAARAVRPGGVVLAAAITRAADIAGDFTKEGDALDEAYARPIREHTYRTGRHHNPEHRRGHFTDAYYHHPHELAGELTGAGFRDVSVYAVEGPAALLRDPDAAMRDPARREGILRALRLTERDPALLGISPHLLAAGVRA
ncbi:class I SAM-dependent methyltransferase [Deinococcus aquaticus]|uniref:class I SAM-dependent methyltransferase n=1 Tax=Deinococcus aquaticus TaxID=328692 RepID=UPI003614B640